MVQSRTELNNGGEVINHKTVGYGESSSNRPFPRAWTEPIEYGSGDGVTTSSIEYYVRVLDGYVSFCLFPPRPPVDI